MNFLGLMTASSYCPPLVSIPQLNCLKELPHDAASTISPFMPSQALGHTHVPTNAAATPPGLTLPKSMTGLSQPCPVPWACPLGFCRTTLPCHSFALGGPLNLLPGPFPSPWSFGVWGRCWLFLSAWCAVPYFLLGEILLPLSKMFLIGTMNHGTSKMACNPRKGFPWDVLNWSWGLVFFSSCKVLKCDSRTARGYGPSVLKIADMREEIWKDRREWNKRQKSCLWLFALCYLS